MNYTIIFLATTFGIVMPLIIGLLSYNEKKLKLQRELAMAGGEELRRELADTKATVVRLLDRVAVLERLATSEDRRVGDEIERLSRSDSRPNV